MALNLPADFQKDIEKQGSTLVPIVVIGNFDGLNWSDYVGYFSTNAINIPIQGIATNEGVPSPTASIPIINEIPSLKQSLDIESRKHKISSTTITLSNLPYDGERFSEKVTSALINTECRIFWLSQSTTIIYPENFNHDVSSAGFQLSKGKIRRYEHSNEKATIIIEDDSEELLNKEIATERLQDDDQGSVPKKYANKSIPLVFGRVDRSPAIIKNKQGYVWEEKQISFELHFDSQSVTANYDKPDGYDVIDYSGFIYINEGQEYYRVIDNLDAHFLESYNYWETPQINNTNIFPEGLPIVHMLGEYKVDTGIIRASNTLADNLLLVDYVSVPIGASPFLLGLSNSYDGGTTSGTVDENSIELISGIMQNIYDLNSETKLSISKHWTPRVIQATEGNNFRGMGYQIQFPALSIQPITADDVIMRNWFNEIDEESLENLLKIKQGDHLMRNNILMKCRFKVFNNNNDYTPVSEFKLIAYSQEPEVLISYDHNQAFATYDFEDVLDNQFLPSGELSPNFGSYEYPQSGLVDKLTYPLLGYKDIGSTVSIYQRNGIGTESTQWELDLFGVSLWQRFLVDQPIGRNYFANITGRITSPSLPILFTHLLKNELNLDVNLSEGSYLGQGYNDNNNQSSNFIYDFTITKKITTKKLFENISSSSPYIPRFDSFGGFSLTEIPHSGGNGVARTISDLDVIDFSYKRTKIEEVYNRVELHYHYDYGTKEFKKTYIADLEYPQQTLDYYGFESDSILIVEDERSKYIRRPCVAGIVAEWLLSWHRNQKLIMKVKLPLRYMTLEIGELVDFDNLLGGVKPYNVDYTINNVLPNGQIIYGKFLIISTKKDLDFCEIECVQLPKLANYSNVNCVDNYDDELGGAPEGSCDQDGNINDICGECGGTAYESGGLIYSSPNDPTPYINCDFVPAALCSQCEQTGDGSGNVVSCGENIYVPYSTCSEAGLCEANLNVANNCNDCESDIFDCCTTENECGENPHCNNNDSYLPNITDQETDYSPVVPISNLDAPVEDWIRIYKSWIFDANGNKGNSAVGRLGYDCLGVCGGDTVEDECGKCDGDCFGMNNPTSDCNKCGNKFAINYAGCHTDNIDNCSEPLTAEVCINDTNDDKYIWKELISDEDLGAYNNAPFSTRRWGTENGMRQGWFYARDYMKDSGGNNVDWAKLFRIIQLYCQGEDLSNANTYNFNYTPYGQLVGTNAGVNVGNNIDACTWSFQDRPAGDVLKGYTGNRLSNGDPFPNVCDPVNAKTSPIINDDNGTIEFGYYPVIVFSAYNWEMPNFSNFDDEQSNAQVPCNMQICIEDQDEEEQVQNMEILQSDLLFYHIQTSVYGDNQNIIYDGSGQQLSDGTGGTVDEYANFPRYLYKKPLYASMKIRACSVEFNFFHFYYNAEGKPLTGYYSDGTAFTDISIDNLNQLEIMNAGNCIMPNNCPDGTFPENWNDYIEGDIEIEDVAFTEDCYVQMQINQTNGGITTGDNSTKLISAVGDTAIQITLNNVENFNENTDWIFKTFVDIEIQVDPEYQNSEGSDGQIGWMPIKLNLNALESGGQGASYEQQVSLCGNGDCETQAEYKMYDSVNKTLKVELPLWRYSAETGNKGSFLEWLSDNLQDNTSLGHESSGYDTNEGWLGEGDRYARFRIRYKTYLMTDGYSQLSVWDDSVYEFGDGSWSVIDFTKCLTGNCCTKDEQGDLNNDGLYNTLDLVALINCIVQYSCPEDGYECTGNMNSGSDSSFDILDIVALSNCILEGNCGVHSED